MPYAARPSPWRRGLVTAGREVEVTRARHPEAPLGPPLMFARPVLALCGSASARREARPQDLPKRPSRHGNRFRLSTTQATVVRHGREGDCADNHLPSRPSFPDTLQRQHVQLTRLPVRARTSDACQGTPSSQRPSRARDDLGSDRTQRPCLSSVWLLPKPILRRMVGAGAETHAAREAAGEAARSH
jgi:hypothetical protein